MEINWILIGVVAIVLIVLILFMIKKNQKEKKKYTELLDNDFKKSEEDETDFDNVSERWFKIPKNKKTVSLLSDTVFCGEYRIRTDHLLPARQAL